ncbi:MAG: GntR family transcriptional regulator [Pseudomonadota bacterium]
MSEPAPTWNDDQPIYRQIADIIVARVLDGTYPEGELMPSVRQVAGEFDVSPLTAAKVFQELDKADLTVKRRGIGAEVREGARKRLLRSERERFLTREWPEIRTKLKRLGLALTDLD